jgi:hypothetical protein
LAGASEKQVPHHAASSCASRRWHTIRPEVSRYQSNATESPKNYDRTTALPKQTTAPPKRNYHSTQAAPLLHRLPQAAAQTPLHYYKYDASSDRVPVLTAPSSTFQHLPAPSNLTSPIHSRYPPRSSQDLGTMMQCSHSQSRSWDDETMLP